MDNQNALTSTAMLAAIWEQEKKDNLELILPFVIYSIGKNFSVGRPVLRDRSYGAPRAGGRRAWH